MQWTDTLRSRVRAALAACAELHPLPGEALRDDETAPKLETPSQVMTASALVGSKLLCALWCRRHAADEPAWDDALDWVSETRQSDLLDALRNDSPDWIESSALELFFLPASSEGLYDLFSEPLPPQPEPEAGVPSFDLDVASAPVAVMAVRRVLLLLTEAGRELLESLDPFPEDLETLCEDLEELPGKLLDDPGQVLLQAPLLVRLESALLEFAAEPSVAGRFARARGSWTVVVHALPLCLAGFEAADGEPGVVGACHPTWLTHELRFAHYAAHWFRTAVDGYLGEAVEGDTGLDEHCEAMSTDIEQVRAFMDGDPLTEVRRVMQSAQAYANELLAALEANDRPEILRGLQDLFDLLVQQLPEYPEWGHITARATTLLLGLVDRTASVLSIDEAELRKRGMARTLTEL